MLLSLAGLSAVPTYLYESAEVDRASAWFKFTRITLPLSAPLILLAVVFRTIDAFKTTDIVWVLTAGGPGSTTETIAYALYKLAFAFLQDRASLCSGGHFTGHGDRPEHYPGARAEPRQSKRHSRRSMAMHKTDSLSKRILVLGGADPPDRDLHVSILLDGRHSLENPHSDLSISHPLFIFTPTLDNFRGVFFTSSGLETNFKEFFKMSIIISALSTFFSVLFGSLAAYSVSRFKMKGKDDLMFFILSTRMLPPIATLVPLFLMYRASGPFRYGARDGAAVHHVQPGLHDLDDEELLR